MPGKIQQQSEITARGNTALRDLARLLARQAAAEAILATKFAGPDQSSPNQLDEDKYNGATIRKPPDN
jgi:hypothetical protein